MACETLKLEQRGTKWWIPLVENVATPLSGPVGGGRGEKLKWVGILNGSLNAPIGVSSHFHRR